MTHVSKTQARKWALRNAASLLERYAGEDAESIAVREGLDEEHEGRIYDALLDLAQSLNSKADALERNRQ